MSIVLAQQYMTRYGMTTYVILGDIGLLFNIAVFSQPLQRRNSCSLYILAGSICAFLGLNISAIPIIYQLDHYSVAMSSLLYCRLQYYFRHAFNLLMRIFFIVACADRYAISSEQIHIRSFSQYKIAIRVIPSIILLFLLISILPSALQHFENGRCGVRSGVCTIINGTYVLIIVGIIPLCSATIFCLLINHNLKTIRRRVQPIAHIQVNTHQVLRKRDRDMLRMLLIEIICYTITTLPTVIMFLYSAITQTIIKSIERQQIEAFIRYITMIFLLYGSNSMSFWLYVYASRSYRLEVKNLIIKYYKFMTGN